jgi:hypothetical protein
MSGANSSLQQKVGFVFNIVIERQDYSAALAQQQFQNFPVTAQLDPALARSVQVGDEQSRQCASANADRQLPAGAANSARQPAHESLSLPGDGNPSECTENVATHIAAPPPPEVRRVLPIERIRANAEEPPLVPRVNYQFALL